MRRLCFGAILLVSLAPALAAAGSVGTPDGLVVHEWGTFTTVVGSGGSALDWRPLNGPVDLPGFVYHIGGTAGSIDPRYSAKFQWRARVRMETPVLYFYAPQEKTVSVKVGFPHGQITEWYPQARQVGAFIDWGAIQVAPGAPADFPIEKGESHYYPARQTDAAPLRVAGRDPEQHERFLFYRGLGTFDLPLSARLVGDQILLKSAAPIGPVVVFENRGGKAGYSVSEMFQSEAALHRPRLEGADSPCASFRALATLPQVIRTMLVQNGLYEKEAEAMIQTWRDSWFEEGMRVFYVVPSALTDAILPITITPQPAELVRVLVARTEIITPEMEQVVEQALTAGDPSAVMRRYGRFAEPILIRLLQTTHNDEVRAPAAALLRAAEAHYSSLAGSR